MTKSRLLVYILLSLLVIFILVILVMLMAKLAHRTRSGTFSITETRIINNANGEAVSQITHYPVQGVQYTSAQQHGTTDKGGKFSYKNGKDILFSIGNLKIGSTKARAEITQHDFPSINEQNLAALLYALDEDNNKNNGIQITERSLPSSGLAIDLNLPVNEFASELTKALTQQGSFTVSKPDGTSFPVSGIGYTSDIATGDTDAQGAFTYLQNKTITLSINGKEVGTVRGANTITPDSFTPPLRYNLHQYLLSMDEDANPENGIQLATIATSIALDFSLPREQFEQKLGKALNRLNRQPAAFFAPTLGINIEAPQAEADTVGQSMPFVDIFRTARPFAEFSEDGVSYDDNGWPTDIPQGKEVYTLLLQSLPDGAIPYGRYTVLYDGTGELSYGGLGKRIEHSGNQEIIDINPNNSTINRLIVKIVNTSTDDPIRNIRIIMPGGICQGMPFLRVDNESECAPGQYQSFASMLQDRNNIVFNPDYLRLLKNFRVLRMMNFMEASQHIPRACYQFKDDEFRDCILQPLTWDMRAKMDDAVWGGSHRTDESKKHGVPIEVLVALANTLKAEPWFTIPHNADDEYVKHFADYVSEHLNDDLKIWVEYSNETWNDRFWGAYYVRYKGHQMALDAEQNPFREGYRYYIKRAVEIFKIWEETFAETDRLIRVAGSYQNSTDLSRNILKYENAYEHLDALAIAPYFHACSNREHRGCKNLLGVNTLLPDATNLDDVFNALQNPYDPYGVPATIKLIQKQAELAQSYNLQLVAYEGGQHLAVNWSDKTRSTAQKKQLSKLFKAANKDSRMGEIYMQLFNSWKAAGGTIFNVFNMPQTWHRWGSWGIKEHLNQPRNKAIKYDAIMNFQEQQGKCWWQGC